MHRCLNTLYSDKNACVNSYCLMQKINKYIMHTCMYYVCMYVCMYVRKFVCMCVHICTYIDTYIQIQPQ